MATSEELILQVPGLIVTRDTIRNRHSAFSFTIIKDIRFSDRPNPVTQWGFKMILWGFCAFVGAIFTDGVLWEFRGSFLTLLIGAIGGCGIVLALAGICVSVTGGLIGKTKFTLTANTDAGPINVYSTFNPEKAKQAFGAIQAEINRRKPPADEAATPGHPGIEGTP